MAELTILHRLSRLLICLLHLLFPPDPTPSNPDLPQEDPTPSNPAPLQDGPTPSNPNPGLPREDRTPSNLAPLPSNPNPVVIGNDLIREILKFLPVKSLMRFKCVSKDWLCIITDPSFTSSYPGCFRGPIVFQDEWTTDAYEMIYYLNIDDTGPTATCEAYYHSTVHRGEELIHTGVVNGLICFYNGNKSWLYNISTRERLHLPVSGPVPAGDAQRYSSTYRLGFDPVSKLYKLLKISSIFDFPLHTSRGSFTSMYTEILTIGVDSSWRIIDSLQPPKPLSAEGRCVHGVIYAMEFYGTRNCFLNAFRLAEERFQSVPLPPDFDHNEEYVNLGRKGTLALLRFSPGLALISYGARPETVNIDRYRYNEVGRESQGTWDSSEILTLPEKHLFPEGICPNGKVLMHDGASDPARLFLYNPIQKEFEKLVVTNWDVGGYSSPRCDSYYNEENIVSLKYLTSSST